ncbi:hypothetical protein GCM10009007_03020 [Formosimonas limnophila]|uniref:PIN domain-containing protein n=1 Tax=Formosimonas limnophila TaxID=1384487 RepID=A0A8J3FYH4_9BURK|nr:hypothetical protein [Formosimonas limnophila]GHA65975.1 hypothetical protein GCM10009007_03020 [Formosimonas limnophila]
MKNNKIIAIDCNFLVLWTSGNKKDKTSHERIELFLSWADAHKIKLLIPMPVISEYLVGADQASTRFISGLSRQNNIILAPFDLPSAYECALIDAAAIQRGDKRDGQSHAWQKIKIDRQIVAIAKTYGATAIISSDKGVVACAARVGIESIEVSLLPISEKDKQMPLLPASKKLN